MKGKQRHKETFLKQEIHVPFVLLKFFFYNFVCEYLILNLLRSIRTREIKKIHNFFKIMLYTFALTTDQLAQGKANKWQSIANRKVKKLFIADLIAIVK
jgi:hypothetical protein